MALRPMIRLAEAPFVSFQGEGHLVGRPQLFVRVQGCPVDCPIRRVCDEPAALQFRGGVEFAVEDVIAAAAAIPVEPWICLTGGEPLAPQHRDGVQELAKACADARVMLHVQTSGAFRSSIRWDWLTVSPKVATPTLGQRFGQEAKVIYTGQTDDELAEFCSATKFWDYYLQPLTTADGSTNVRDTVDTIFRLHQRGQLWNLSQQTHKFAGVR